MRPRERVYTEAFRSAVLQGLVTMAWVAAGELPAGERRLARLGMVLAMAAAGFAGQHDTVTVEVAPRPRMPESSAPDAGVNLNRVVIAAALVPPLTVAPVVIRRRLERRWLAQLRRSGHLHPHRAVAVRFGLITVIGTLVSDLTKAQDRGTRWLRHVQTER